MLSYLRGGGEVQVHCARHRTQREQARIGAEGGGGGAADALETHLERICCVHLPPSPPLLLLLLSTTLAVPRASVTVTVAVVGRRTLPAVAPIYHRVSPAGCCKARALCSYSRRPARRSYNHGRRRSGLVPGSATRSAPTHSHVVTRAQGSRPTSTSSVTTTAPDASTQRRHSTTSVTTTTGPPSPPLTPPPPPQHRSAERRVRKARRSRRKPDK